MILSQTDYLHTNIGDLSAEFSKDNPVIITGHTDINSFDSIKNTFAAKRLAIRIGIQNPKPFGSDNLPYSDDNDNIVFEAPLLSFIAGMRIGFLRGWKQYESCVKGFNAMGLLAEHVEKELNYLGSLERDSIIKLKKDFVKTRKKKSSFSESLEHVFSEDEVNSLTNVEYERISLFDVAIWHAFYDRPIICSTSSNMGISLHQVIRNIQSTKINLKDRTFSILNDDEGNLVIWCPDERADFMNAEKTEVLRRLEIEQPPLTVLHTYISRIERDPGALRDALISGGYFFPTNPQSEEEMQNLLFMSLNDIARERNTGLSDILRDPKIKRALESLDCTIADGKVSVKRGVVGGIFGLMLPYFLCFEEILQSDELAALSIWNQASIGAGLGGLVMADMRLREYQKMPEPLKNDLHELFPSLSIFLSKRIIGKQIQTRIHGVFDLANLQSLAQLLGVVVEKHLSGRKTALVGLGSSSYATGNRCYDILKYSKKIDGPFKGKTTFHPTTHALIPIAQALIYGEDLFRVVTSKKFKQIEKTEQVRFIMQHVVKPEPAGAASVAGFLLSRLDLGSLSFIEITVVLKLVGFTQESFLEFAGFGKETGSANLFLQDAYEEGEPMGQLAKNILTVLGWDISKLEEKALIERIHSRYNYRLHTLDDPDFEALKPFTLLNITGDNCRPPSEALVVKLLENCLINKEQISKELSEDIFYFKMQQRSFASIDRYNYIFTVFIRLLKAAQNRVELVKISLIKSIIVKKVDQSVKEYPAYHTPYSIHEGKEKT